MGRFCVFLLVLALVVATNARNVPSDVGLKEEKNVVSYGGVGGFSGLGNNGLPFGGVGAGIGGGVDGGVLGGGLGGGIAGGVAGGLGGGGGGGGGSGVLPFP